MMLSLLERIFGAAPHVEPEPDPDLKEVLDTLAREEERARRERARANRVVERYAPEVNRRSDPADAIRRAQQLRSES
jgi:hypothetical protein